MTKEEFEKAAQFYFKKGWNFIPLNFLKAVEVNGKIEKRTQFPESYLEYHKKKVNPSLVEDWAKRYNAIAIVTGEISGITVIDIDTKELPEMKELPETFTTETNKGFHFYFNFLNGLTTTVHRFKAKESEFNIDIRNNGGIVYAAPSSYELPNGDITKYKVVKNLPLADFPTEWMKKMIEKYGAENEKTFVAGSSWKDKLIAPIENGTRNVSFTSIIGGLLAKFPQDEWDTIVWGNVKQINKVQEESLEEGELKVVFNSIAKKELQKRNIEGEIKEILTEIVNEYEEVKINVLLEKVIVHFKIKNIYFNLMEGDSVAYIEKQGKFGSDISFHFKLKSDESRKNWIKILKDAFDKPREEKYPWTLIVNKVANEISKIIKDKKQAFFAYEIEAKPPEWLIQPFIEKDDINTFYGLGESGKTLMGIYFSIVLAKRGIKSLFIDYENTGGKWKNRVVKMANEESMKNLMYFETEQIPFAEQIEKIKEIIKKNGIEIIIVDSASVAGGRSTSDEDSAVRLLSAMKSTKKTAILIAHQRKNDGEDSPIGSVQYYNLSRVVWGFYAEQDNEYNHVLHIACKHKKSNHSAKEKEPIGFKVNFLGDTIEIEKEDAIKNFEQKFTATERIKNLLENESGLTYKKIAEKLGMNGKYIPVVLNRGKIKGIFDNDSEQKWYVKNG